MEPSTKLCVSICIFAPAFIYFLIAVSRSPKAEYRGFVAESEMIYNPQRWPPEQRKKAYALADKYNQNIRPEEYISPQIARGLPQ
ncbi:hypothetical protein V3C99_015034 [Haemonchus contortus]|uniref:Uncharacterized protein n=1 Tax=Haemonchus contortus TaxID=6289 RepID=A0A7I4YTW3_HAECO